MATIRQRGDRWQVIVQVRQPDGTRRTSSATFDTRDEAKLHANRLEYAVRSGELTGNRATIAELADTWLALQRHRKHATVLAYTGALGRACQQLGRHQARHLTAGQCDLAWSALLDRYSPRTVQQARTTLSTCLTWAVAAGVIPANPVPASRVRAAERTEPLDTAAVLTAAELAQLLAWIGPAPWPALWRVLADTGLRQGEARALRWRDIDTDSRRLRVAATMTRSPVDGERVGQPKSRESRRSVPLTRPAAHALARHRAELAERAGLAATGPDRFVFARAPRSGDTAGRPLSARTLSQWWHRALASTGLRRTLTPHALRHTYASALLAEGVPLVRVAALLGHSPQVCASTYAHWIDTADDHAAEILERSRAAQVRR